MPDQGLNIAIKTSADVSGALKVKASLEEQILKAKLLGESFEKQTEQLRNVNRALEEYKAQGGDVAKEAEHMEVSHRELHHLFGMMGRESIPEVGEAMTGLLYGPAGALLVVAAGFSYLTKQIAAAHEAAEKFAALKWSAQIDSINEARQSADDLADALEKAARANDPIKAQYDQQLAVLNAHVEAHRKILAALEQEEIAAAGGDKAKQEEIKSRYAGPAAAYDTKTAEEKRQLEQKTREEHEKAAETAEYHAIAARALAQKAETDPNYIANRNAVENATPERKEKIATARALVDAKGGRDAVLGLPAPPEPTEIPAIGKDEGAVDFVALFKRDEWEKAQEAVRLLDEFDQQQAEITRQAAMIAKLKKKEAEAQEEATKHTAAAANIATTQATDRKTRDQTDAGADVGKAIGIERKVLAGGELNKGEEEFLRTIGTVIAGHNVTLKTAEAMFAVASKNSKTMDAMINELASAMDRMSDAVLTNFNRRMSDLDQKIKQIDQTAQRALNAANLR